MLDEYIDYDDDVSLELIYEAALVNGEAIILANTVAMGINFVLTSAVMILIEKLGFPSLVDLELEHASFATRKRDALNSQV